MNNILLMILYSEVFKLEGMDWDLEQGALMSEIWNNGYALICYWFKFVFIIVARELVYINTIIPGFQWLSG